MGDNTKIEWADATISPLYGCSKVSPACANCYAERLAARFSKNPATAELYAGTVDERGHWTGRLNLHEDRMVQALRWKSPRRIFIASQSDLFHEDAPDWFIDTVFAHMLASHMLDNCARHTFLLLTKRAERMRDYLSADPPVLLERWAKAGDGLIILDNADVYFSELVYSHTSWNWSDRGRVLKPYGYTEGLFPLPNVHVGVTVENQEQANARIPLLLETPAALRFVSVEPMLGPVELTGWIGTHNCHLCYGDRFFLEDCEEDEHEHEVCPNCGRAGGVGTWDSWLGRTYDGPGIVHVICGGESGPNARPMHPDWVRSLRDQCAGAGVPFMFKQWGEWTPGESVVRQRGTVATAKWLNDAWSLHEEDLASTDGHYDDEPDLYRIGKKASGRHLDGRTWDGFPAA